MYHENFNCDGERKALRYTMYPDPDSDTGDPRYTSSWRNCTNESEEKSIRFWVP